MIYFFCPGGQRDGMCGEREAPEGLWGLWIMHHFFGLFCRPPADHRGFEARKTWWLQRVCCVNRPNFTLPCWQRGERKKTNPNKTHFYEFQTQDLWEAVWTAADVKKNNDGNWTNFIPNFHWKPAEAVFFPPSLRFIRCFLFEALLLCHTHTPQDIIKLVESQDTSHLFVCKIPTHAAAVSHGASEEPAGYLDIFLITELLWDVFHARLQSDFFSSSSFFSLSLQSGSTAVVPRWREGGKFPSLIWIYCRGKRQTVNGNNNGNFISTTGWEFVSHVKKKILDCQLSCECLHVQHQKSQNWEFECFAARLFPALSTTVPRFSHLTHSAAAADLNITSMSTFC